MYVHQGKERKERNGLHCLFHYSFIQIDANLIRFDQTVLDLELLPEYLADSCRLAVLQSSH